MDKRGLGLWLGVAIALLLVVFLPRDGTVSLNAGEDIELAGSKRTFEYAKRALMCACLHNAERNNLAAASITISEASMRGRFEQNVEDTIFRISPTLLRYLDKSIGPAQLKSKHFDHQSRYSPIELCDSIALVREMIVRAAPQTVNDWKEFLERYIGVKQTTLQSAIYQRYSAGAWYNLRGETNLEPPWLGAKP